MKKTIFFTLIFASFFLMNQNIQAQAFQKGNLNFDLGIGFGIYGTSQTQTFKVSVAGAPIIDDKQDTTDGAASMIIPLSFEYGLTDKVGLGVDLTYSNYFISDSDNVNTESVKAFDVGAKFNYHLLNSDKNDLMIGIGIGYSNMSWKFIPTDVTNPFESESAGGSGVYWTIGVTDRIFFTDNIGILFNLNYRGYSYSNIEYELTSEANQILTAADAEYSNKLVFNMNGVHFGLGLAVKF